MITFDKLKRYHVERLKKAMESGEADEPIYYLLNYINSLDNYFTTSSCAGRIILIKIPESGKKKDAKFLFKSHYPVKFEEIYQKLLEVYDKYKEKIYFKQEPLILHIAAKDINSAIVMLDIARKAGFKHSGIFLIKEERVMLEVIGNEKIETIISKNKKLLISEEYFRELVEEANKKLIRVMENTRRFYDLLFSNFK